MAVLLTYRLWAPFIERVLLLLIIIHISRIRAAPLQCSDFANDIVVTKSPVPGNVTLAITQTINGSDAFDYLCYCIAFPVGNRLISLADITGLNVTNANVNPTLSSSFGLTLPIANSRRASTYIVTAMLNQSKSTESTRPVPSKRATVQLDRILRKPGSIRLILLAYAVPRH
ncbi:hypothetical protein BVRB_026190 [Beta vulgaris subsp. vulgaris]|uniref:Uncharacterized protein n=1 Tax=Beta vulgaris subsp. vulgaris TaxID=3555 RepID=A0A0J8AZ22_BETVV|nr:hypothetical protein BVRB_026190 [Beta vulgaris subsp. vulgaris]